MDEITACRASSSRFENDTEIVFQNGLLRSVERESGKVGQPYTTRKGTEKVTAILAHYLE